MVAREPYKPNKQKKSKNGAAIKLMKEWSGNRATKGIRYKFRLGF